MSRKLTLLLLFCILCFVANAQEFRATISGHVYDASGAAVPGAKIEVVNIDTSDTATATTSASGAYSVPFLPPGNYKMTVGAAGFKSSVRENVTLEAAKVAGIDV